MSEEGIWPGPHKCAVSICFDDGYASQLHHAVPALHRKRMVASFYPHTRKLDVARPTFRRELLQRWGALRAAGHEIGNHTVSHPCSTDFSWVAQQTTPLEELTLAGIQREIEDAQRFLEAELGVSARTFAYPCGMSFVGRGVGRKSYVPLIATRFQIGRSFNNECAAAPLRCDLACVPAISMDRKDGATLCALVDAAVEAGDWLVLGGHGVSDSPGAYVTNLRALEGLLDHLASLEGAVWVDTVERVGSYLARRREKGLSAPLASASAEVAGAFRGDRC